MTHRITELRDTLSRLADLLPELEPVEQAYALDHLSALGVRVIVAGGGACSECAGSGYRRRPNLGARIPHVTLLPCVCDAGADKHPVQIERYDLVSLGHQVSISLNIYSGGTATRMSVEEGSEWWCPELVPTDEERAAFARMAEAQREERDLAAQRRRDMVPDHVHEARRYFGIINLDEEE